ncbi:Guanine nucleotide exchange factor VAV2 [Frankliniella fusca]|uniref:Guanine nucleotide exchange factor VAV2 n=1 Tax=Frankliniella fusca TaxID=407009 RepID=A0AAE1L6V7_9NEOP|nr:Guanine nucleotide exchange factor VAV2 [Frankliniella fusca]
MGMSADSLATIMASSGGTAIAAAYQALPCSDTLGNPPRNSISTSHNSANPVVYPCEFTSPSEITPSRFQPNRSGPRAIRKTTYSSNINAKKTPNPVGRIPDLKDMEKYVDSPLAISRYDPGTFLDDFVFDNAPICAAPKEDTKKDQKLWPTFEGTSMVDESRWTSNLVPKNDVVWPTVSTEKDRFWSRDEVLKSDELYWPPRPRSVETSPSSSVSAVSPIGIGPLWAPLDTSFGSDRSSPMETSLVDVFENMRPFNSSFY